MSREHVYGAYHTVTVGDPSGDPPTARRVRLRVTVGWTPGDPPVTLGVTAHDRDADGGRGDEPAVGGYHASLDAAALDRLLDVLRTARDDLGRSRRST